MEMTNENLKQIKTELEAVCKKHNIVLIPVIVHQGNRTSSSIDIVPASVFEQPEVPAPDQA